MSVEPAAHEREQHGPCVGLPDDAVQVGDQAAHPAEFAAGARHRGVMGHVHGESGGSAPQVASAPPSARGSEPTSNDPRNARRITCACPTASSRSPNASTRNPASSSRIVRGVGHATLAHASGPSSSHTVQRGAPTASAGGHAQVEGSDQVLGVDLRLGGAAHGGRDGRQAAIAVDEHRHQRVEGALPGRDLVRMAGLEREAGAAVVRDDAGLRFEDPCAEAVVQALDQRDRPPFGVRGRPARSCRPCCGDARARPRERASRTSSARPAMCPSSRSVDGWMRIASGSAR